MQKSSKEIWILFCIVLVGLGLRLVNLGQQPFWGDEVLSLDISTSIKHVGDIWRYLAAVEVHPPLYYTMMHFWAGWFGTGTFPVKSLSMIFGLGCIVVSYYWGKVIFRSGKVGLLAAGIVAVLPFQLEFSQEARPYIIFCFFGMLATLCLWQYFRTSRRIYWLGYGLANLAGLYLHYSYLFIFAALALWGLVEIWQLPKARSREFVIWLSVHATIFLGFSFWLVPFLYKIVLGSLTIFGWSRITGSQRVPYFFEFVISQLVWLTKEENLSQIVLLVSFLAKGLLLAGFTWVVSQLYKKPRFESWWPALFMLWMLFMPLVFFFFSPQSVYYSVIFERHIIFLSIPIVLLIAWLINLLPRRSALVVATVLLVSLIPYTAGILGNDAQWDQDYHLQSDAELINQNYQPGDIVIVSVAYVRTNLSHYLADDIPVYPMLPINYYFNNFDDYGSRHLLGFIENEYQSRFTKATESQIDAKIDTLVKLYHPKRVWLYGFDLKEYAVNHWFTDRQWRHIYGNLGDISLVDLYSVK